MVLNPTSHINCPRLYVLTHNGHLLRGSVPWECGVSNIVPPAVFLPGSRRVQRAWDSWGIWKKWQKIHSVIYWKPSRHLTRHFFYLVFSATSWEQVLLFSFTCAETETEGSGKVRVGLLSCMKSSVRSQHGRLTLAISSRSRTFLSRSLGENPRSGADPRLDHACLCSQCFRQCDFLLEN